MGIHGEEFIMVGFCSGLSLHMHTPLKRDVIIGLHARKSRDRRVDCFKICEVQRIIELCQFRRQFRAEPRVACLNGGAGMPLNLAQLEVIGYIANQIDADLFQFLRCAGMESWQVADVAIRAR